MPSRALPENSRDLHASPIVWGISVALLWAEDQQWQSLLFTISSVWWKIYRIFHRTNQGDMLLMRTTLGKTDLCESPFGRCWQFPSPTGHWFAQMPKLSKTMKLGLFGICFTIWMVAASFIFIGHTQPDSEQRPFHNSLAQPKQPGPGIQSFQESVWQSFGQMCWLFPSITWFCGIDTWRLHDSNFSKEATKGHVGSRGGCNGGYKGKDPNRTRTMPTKYWGITGRFASLHVCFDFGDT